MFCYIVYLIVKADIFSKQSLPIYVYITPQWHRFVATSQFYRLVGAAYAEVNVWGGRTSSGKATNYLGGTKGMLPRENFRFLELGNAISRLLTRIFYLICLAEI